MLSVSQLATLAELGEERTAAVGDVLYGVGAQSYPFIAILEGEVAILDPAGHEIVRHGPSRFLGELNFLSGQTVFVSAVVATPLRYIAVERDVMREQLFEDGPLSDLVLSTFIARREALQTVDGLGVEIAGPRSSAPTMRMLDFVRRNRLPFSWRDEPVDGAALYALCLEFKEKLGHRIVDTVPMVRHAIENRQNILLEGQLGVMRDLDWGIYPYVTSSNPTVGQPPIT